MTAPSEPDKATFDQLSPNADSGVANANKRALHFVLGAQRFLFEEMVFVGAETFDRALAEMQLFSEFSSKMASAHSVKTIGTFGAECARHQIDFVRRDCDRMLRHAGRLVENASKLFDSRPQS